MEQSRSRNSRSNKRSARKKWIIMISVIAGIIICVAIYAGLILSPIKNARQNLQSGQTYLMTAYSLSTEGKLKDAESQFEKAKVEFNTADSALSSNLFLPLQITPIANNNLEAVRRLTKAGYHISSAGSLAAATFLGKTGSSAGTTSEKDKSALFSNGQINIAALNSMSANAKKISDDLNAASEAYDGMPTRFLIPPLSVASEKFGEKMPKLRQVSETINAVTGILPGFLGGNGKRSYFLAIQNNAELRATGGLIGNYGIVTLENGKMAMNEFNEIHALQRMKPKPVKMPQEFMTRYGRYSSNSMWLNANMSPDFPTNGDLLSKLYESSTGRKVDGVISIDPVALKYILEALGPVTIPGMNKHVYSINSSNVVDETLVKAYEQFAERSDRKNFLADVATIVWIRILSGDFDVVSLAKKIAVAFEEKHMAAYSRFGNEEKVIEELGYSGLIKKTNGDYLQVILQNHSGSKLDVYTHQMIDYNITINEDNSAQVVATVSIENGAQPEKLPDYVAGYGISAPRGYTNTWLNLFVSKKAQLLSATLDGRDVNVEVGREKDKAVFSQYVQTKPGSQSKLIFTYTIPNVVTLGKNGPEYVLDVQAQPVLNPPAFSFTINAPQGFTSIPELCTKEGNTASFQSWITKDTQFKFKLAGSN